MDTQNGTNGVDTLIGGEGQDEINAGAGDDTLKGNGDHDRLEGELDNDLIEGGAGNDLAVGDNVGAEWSLVNGRWVYDASKNSGSGDGPKHDDTVSGGDGLDVVIGNGGDDLLYGGGGADTINAGAHNDIAFGGTGDDLINLDSGDDLAYGGRGADTINGGDGDDIMYGDLGETSILENGRGNSGSFSQHAESGGWVASEAEDGSTLMSQTIDTTAGESYELTFDIAANTGAGSHAGCVEVIWNGEVIQTLDASAGLEAHTFTLEGIGRPTELSFRSVPVQGENTGPEIITGGPINYYTKDMPVGGEDVSVAAFAPGQASLYQVIDGQLKVFDTAANSYADAGPSTGLKLNAIGFNAEDDMIYGVAKKAGVDALGNPVDVTDIVMMDAKGAAYRIGDGPTGDYVGDFDDSGNLWTFNSSLNRATKVDVDSLDANGNPTITNYDLPNDLMTGNIYDIAFSSADNAFMAVQAPGRNGGEGQLHKIDLSKLDANGSPEISSIPISSTMIDGAMESGMVKGAYGAVFLDGEGNIFAGLNRGDHDLDGSTGSQGAIYKINADFTAGEAFAEFMSESQSTGSNDGAVDPRATDPFAPVDESADIVITPPQLKSLEGGDDHLRGGDGDDKAFGGAGDDVLHGGSGSDVMSGDAGNDFVDGGTGDDALSGGAGDDKLLGQSGNDELSGGEGKDYLNAGSGDDVISGGAGNDKIVGGSGADRIEGGAGDDHMWGGNWWRDGSVDTFVVSAGSGKDMIHDFEVDKDQIDLSSYGLEFADLAGLVKDKGWATEIDLSGIAGGIEGDKLILKSVDADDLDETNFIL